MSPNTAFVDLGGIDGLLHLTDLSWGRIKHPSDVVKPDQNSMSSF
jgi:ribosomal protein S1